MLFDLRTENCPSCGKEMMQKAPYGVFPHWVQADQDAQTKAEGVVYISDATSNGEHICKECKVSGLAHFKCVLCDQERKSNEIQETFGDPAEYLCKTCYGTVSAKEWDAKVDLLIEAHRYDFQ